MRKSGGLRVRNPVDNPLGWLYPFAAELPHLGEPASLATFGDVLRRTKPCGMHPKARKPQNPPFELRVDVAREQPHEQRVCAACDDDAGALAAHETMPKHSPFTGRSPYVTEFGTWEPRPIEKPFEECGHAHPPDGMYDDEVF